MEDGVLDFGPGLGVGIDQVVVASGGDFCVMDILAAGLLLLGIVSAEVGRDDIIGRAMNEPLGGGMADGELHGIGFAVVFGDVRGFAAKKLDDGVMAEMQVPGLLEIDNSGEWDYFF